MLANQSKKTEIISVNMHVTQAWGLAWCASHVASIHSLRYCTIGRLKVIAAALAPSREEAEFDASVEL